VKPTVYMEKRKEKNWVEGGGKKGKKRRKEKKSL